MGKVISSRVLTASVVAAFVLVFGLGVTDAYASQQAELTSASSLSISTQASASPTCALLRKDGNLWRCTSKGVPVSKFWSAKVSTSRQLGRVKTVFVASNVSAITERSNFWTRYVRSTGSVSDYRYTASYSYLLSHVTKVKFLTNSKGVNNCKVVDNWTFSNAKSLKTLANFNKTKVKRVGSYAFARSGVKSLAMPKTLKTIDKYAFVGCEKLTSFSGLNKTGLSSIGYSAFSDCKKLRSVSLPSACKRTGEYAFSGCVGLKSASLGAKTALVDAGSFYNCEMLAAVDLPATCTKIGLSAFSGCSSLNKVVMRSNSIVENAYRVGNSLYGQFARTPIQVTGNSAYIYVPKSLLSRYQVNHYTNPWYDYRTKFRAV